MVENQRLRAREFEKYMKGRPRGLFIHLGFGLLRDGHPGLYDRVSAIPTNFRIRDAQAQDLKQAASILVGKAVERIRADAYWAGRFN